MLSPYGLDIIANCLTCQMRPERLFCDLSPKALQAFEAVKCATAYPKGIVLFAEGQMPSTIFVLCKGKVKMSTCAGDGQRYELTAERVESCQVNLVKRHDGWHAAGSRGLTEILQ